MDGREPRQPCSPFWPVRTITRRRVLRHLADLADSSRIESLQLRLRVKGDRPRWGGRAQRNRGAPGRPLACTRRCAPRRTGVQPTAVRRRVAAPAADRMFYQGHPLAWHVSCRSSLHRQRGGVCSMSCERGTQGYVIQDRAADGLHRLACLVRSEPSTQSDAASQIAHYRNGAAARLDSMATYVRGADLPTALRDVGQFARRRPEVLVVGGFLTGFLGARVARPWRRARVY